MLEFSNIIVFREKYLDDGKTAFDWYRVANDDEDGHIVVAKTLSEQEHLELLELDI